MFTLKSLRSFIATQFNHGAAQPPPQTFIKEHEMTTYELAYEVFTGKNAHLTVKRKTFKTEKALQQFVEKVAATDNFYRFLGTSERRTS